MSINRGNHRNVNPFPILLIVLLFPCLIKAKEPVWHQKLKQIKPAQSTRADVERIFASLKVELSFVEDGIEWVFYRAGEGKISARYSTGKCTTEKTQGYDLENGTVTNIIFFPETEIRFSKFKVDRKKLFKVYDIHGSVWHFVNRESGEDYVIGEDGVSHVKFTISLNQDYLKCKDWKPLAFVINSNL